MAKHHCAHHTNSTAVLSLPHWRAQVVSSHVGPPRVPLQDVMDTRRHCAFCACNTICGGHKPSQLLRRPGDSQEVVTSQEATIWRPGEVVAKRWPTSGSQEARWPPAKRQSSGHRWQRRGQVLVPRAVVKWEPEVAPSQAVAKWPRSLILKWLLNMLRQLVVDIDGDGHAAAPICMCRSLCW